MNNQKLVFALLTLLALFSAALLLVSMPIALGFFLALVTGALVFFKPFAGLIIYIMIVFIIPQNIFPGLIKFRLNLTMAIIVLAICFTHKLLRRERISFFDTRQQNLMFLLTIAVPLSNISNLHFRAAWDGVDYFLTVFLLFFIIINLSDSYKKFRACCWTLVACTTLLVINGIIQRLRGVDLVGVLPVEGNRIRYFSHFGDPNDFALLVNAFLPFILVSIFEKGIRGLTKTLLVLLAALYVLALYFTNSRGGYVALLAMMAYFAFTKWGRFKGAAIAVLVVLIGLILAPNRMAEISSNDGSASGRLNAWAAGLVMLKSHPVFGIGFKMFEFHHERSAHNAFINCAAELGLVGYFIWIALLYTSFTALKTLERSPTRTPYAIYARILELSLVGFLVSAFFLSQTYSPVLYILLALITHAVYNPESRLNIPRFLSTRDLARIAAMIVVSILMFKVLAILYV